VQVYGTPDSVTANADDGTSVSFGGFADGETKTKEFQISKSASSVDLSADGGRFDWKIAAKENRQTDSPSVEVNGHWTNHTGLMNDGETASLPTNESWIRNGTNRVNVSLAGGTVNLTYSHTARHDRSVSYTAEAWSERYNVTRTWGYGATDANLSIPFAGNVVQNRDLRVFINGTETSPTYSKFENTTLEVGLGDLDSGATTRVVANGSKVVVENGSIQVVEPTTEGNDLDTRFRITSKDPGFRIDVSGTSEADRVHYLANASYTPVEAHTRISGGGARQYLHAPNASAGSTVSARTLPLAVEPGNDVVVEVADPDSPRFELRPGQVSGDSVQLTYYETTEGDEYDLLDVDDGKVVASDTAQSPVSFEVSDDSTLYEIRSSDGTSASSSGGGGGGSGRRVDISSVTDEPLANPIVVIVVAAVVVLLGAYVASRTALSFRAVAVAGVLVGLGALEVLRPGAVSGPVSAFLGTASTVGPALWLAGGVAGLLVVYGLYRRFGRADRYVLPVRGGAK